MICKEYNSLFVHIPRTAGQSVEHFFLRLLGLCWQDRYRLLLRINQDPKRGPRRLAHLTASEYVSLGYLTASEFDSYYHECPVN
jgi:site-specific recombinase